MWVRSLSEMASHINCVGRIAEVAEHIHMSPMRFIKFFGIALGVQFFFLLGGYTLLFGPSGERQFRDSMLLYLYRPFIELIIRTGGYRGESSMIWPPLFGTILGIFIYSGLFAVIVAYLTRKK